MVQSHELSIGTDIIMIINFIIGNNEPTTSEFITSDMNEDGNINVVDIVAIVNVILGD